MDKGDISKWEMKYDGGIDFIQLKKDKVLAFSKMIPKDTENVYQSKLVYGYFNNRIVNKFNMINELIHCHSEMLKIIILVLIILSRI